MYVVKTIIAAVVICIIIYLTGLIPKELIHLNEFEEVIDYSISMKIRYIMIIVLSVILYKYLKN
jgi:hypothetical protein